jgi:hypothetical protein
MTKKEAVEILERNGFHWRYGLGATSTYALDDLEVTVSDSWVDVDNGNSHVENTMQNLDKMEMDKGYLGLWFKGGTIVVLRRIR